VRAVSITDDVQIEVVDVVEIDAAEPEGAGAEALQDQLDKVVDAIRLAFERVPAAARNVSAELAPDEFEIEFGVSVTGKMKAIFAGAEGSTAFKVKATWKKSSAGQDVPREP
jgi:hypothetical protein